jgi:hypothetical protein
VVQLNLLRLTLEVTLFRVSGLPCFTQGHVALFQKPSSRARYNKSGRRNVCSRETYVIRGKKQKDKR